MKINYIKKDFKSIENQINILTEYTNKNHFNIVKVYIDDGVSGASTSRNGLNELLEDATRISLKCC
ncbi:MAG: recombinase family protein [bacterium]